MLRAACRALGRADVQGFPAHQQTSNKTEQSQDGTENLNDKDLDKPRVQRNGKYPEANSGAGPKGQVSLGAQTNSPG